jgi:hypothetical protein
MMDFNNRMVRSAAVEKQEQQLNARIVALEQTKQRLKRTLPTPTPTVRWKSGT